MIVIFVGGGGVGSVGDVGVGGVGGGRGVVVLVIKRAVSK